MSISYSESAVRRYTGDRWLDCGLLLHCWLITFRCTIRFFQSYFIVTMYLELCCLYNVNIVSGERWPRSIGRVCWLDMKPLCVWSVILFVALISASPVVNPRSFCDARRGARTARATLCCHTSSQRRGMNWAHCASSAVSLCLAAALNASCLCFNLWMERECHQPSSQAGYPGQCHPLLDIIDRYLHIIDT